MKKIKSIPSVADIPETVPKSVNSNEIGNAKWFYGPTTDLIIGCGAWSVPLLLLTYYGTTNFPQTVITVFYALALFFNYPHYMATIYRAYRTKEDFAKYKIFTVHITLLIALLVVLGHFSSYLLAVVFTIYLTWSPFHYTGQNFGIGLMFARRGGVKTDLKTRRAFYISFLAPYLMFFLAFHSGTASDDYVLSLGIPFRTALFLWLIVFAAFVISTVYSFRAFIKQTSFSTMSAPLVILSTQIVWFVIPTGLMFFTNTGILQNPATIAVLAVMHSAQYLWITTYYARREKLNESKDTESVLPNRWKYSSYFSILIVGGIALFLPVPWLASRILHLDFGTSFLIITALVNIHHFILDGAIWKLRDGRIATLLLNKNNDREKVVTSSGSLTRWFSGSGSSARFVKAAAVFGLLLLAGLDQAKFYFGTKGNDASNLEIASQLNPFDASLKLKLARSSEAKGNLTEAQNSLEAAVRINPSFRQAQDSLARLLIQSGRYQEAYNHYQKMFEHLAPDANSLINYGVLAAQFDNPDSAEKSWQDALKLDHNQPNAHFYLAELMAKRKNFDGAITHYEQFLALIGSNQNASSDANELPNPYRILQAALSLGNAYRQVGKREKSLAVFNKAVGLAESISDRESLTTALIHRAEIEHDEGNFIQALDDFQRALSLPKKDTSYGGKSADWFKFGLFLKDSKAASRLIFACFLKAEMQMKTETVEEPTDTISEMLKAEINQLEPLSNKEAESIRNNINPVLQEALSIELQ
jgi:tetratricopeptide (TPR) repeat protein